MKWLSTALCLALAACTSMEVRDNPSSQEVVSIGRNYQSVYRDLRSWSLDCLQTTDIASQAKVDAELYADLGKGEISYYRSGLLGQVHYARFEIDRIAPSQSTLTIKKGAQSLGGFPRVIEVARSGRSQGC